MKLSEIIKMSGGEADALFEQLSTVNPMGTLILNDQLEVIYLNETVRGYFGGNADETMRFFGNVFKCQSVHESGANCGTMQACTTCKIRASVLDAKLQHKVVRNIEIKNGFIVNGVKQIKWLDLSVVPIDFQERLYLWITVVDLTEIMKYKIEFEMIGTRNDEDYTLEKDAFHNEVMQYIKTHCYTGGEAFLMLFELSHTQAIQDKFGSLWRNDYVFAFQQHLEAQLRPTDLVCRYTMDQFLVFLPCVEESEVQCFLDLVKTYRYQHIQALNDIAYRRVKLVMSSDNVREIMNGDLLYMTYFKAISKLENLNAGETVALMFE